jgi:carboxypeptidase T
VKLIALAALAAACAVCQPAVAGADRASLDQLMEQEMRTENVYRVYAPDAATLLKASISLHDNLLETNRKAGYLVAQLDARELQKLQAFGLRIEKDDEYIARRNRRLQRLRDAGAPNLLGANAAIPGFPCYETVEETFAAAQGFTTTYPNLAAWSDAGNSWEKSQGLGGYDMRVLTLTNKLTTGVDGGPKPKLFISSTIHAREYATAPLILAFARQLLEGYGTDADATWILDHHEVHLMLVTNPDGRKMAESGLLWRKNTNQAYCGATSNDRGADLNRNFTFSWNITNGQGSSGQACDETYRGASAGSEPEVQAEQAYVRSLWPDRRGPHQNDPAPADTSGIHLDIHSYGELVLWPWGHTNTASPNAAALTTLGRRFAWYNGYLPEQAIGLYPTDGTSDGVSYGELGVAAYTFELGTNFFQSCSVYNNTIKPKNLPALLYAAKVVRTPYLTPAGPDVAKLRLSNHAATTGVRAGKAVTLTATINDKHFSARNGTEPVQKIVSADVFIDSPPWMPGATGVPLAAADGAFDTSAESVTGVVNTTGLAAGHHLLFVRGRDASGSDGPVTASFLVIR